MGFRIVVTFALLALASAGCVDSGGDSAAGSDDPPAAPTASAPQDSTAGDGTAAQDDMLAQGDSMTPMTIPNGPQGTGGSAAQPPPPPPPTSPTPSSMVPGTAGSAATPTPVPGMDGGPVSSGLPLDDVGMSADGAVFTNRPDLTFINSGNADLVITTAYFQPNDRTITTDSLTSAGLLENRGSVRHCVGGFSFSDLGGQNLGLVAISSVRAYKRSDSALVSTCVEPGETALWWSTTLNADLTVIAAAESFEYAIVPADDSAADVVLHPSEPELLDGQWQGRSYVGTLVTGPDPINTITVGVWAMTADGLPVERLSESLFTGMTAPVDSQVSFMTLELRSYEGVIADTFVSLDFIDGEAQE